MPRGSHVDRGPFMCESNMSNILQCYIFYVTEIAFLRLICHEKIGTETFYVISNKQNSRPISATFALKIYHEVYNLEIMVFKMFGNKIMIGNGFQNVWFFSKTNVQPY